MPKKHPDSPLNELFFLTVSYLKLLDLHGLNLLQANLKIIVHEVILSEKL